MEELALNEEPRTVKSFFGSNAGYAIVTGDCRKLLVSVPDESVDLTVTSPPYFQQKDYDSTQQIGWDQSRDEYLNAIGTVLGELLRVTRPTGSVFIVIADTYKNKSLQLIPQAVALIASDIGWTIRNDLIWSKTDAAPENVVDRWRYSHEYIFFMVKKPTGYTFEMDSVRVPYADVTLKRWGKGQKYGGQKSSETAGPRGQRFRRGKSFSLNSKGALPPDVLSYATSRSPHTHYATYPPSLVKTFVEATSVPGGIVLDPFVGSGTTGRVAVECGRRFLGFDVNASYAEIAASECHEALVCWNNEDM